MPIRHAPGRVWSTGKSHRCGYTGVVLDAYHANVISLPNGLCWLWRGARNHKGYGIVATVRSDGTKTTVAAHRVSYLMYIGEIPAGYEVDHLCRVRLCVNPLHLELVTPDENKRRAWVHRRERAHIDRILARRLDLTGIHADGSTAR